MDDDIDVPLSCELNEKSPRSIDLAPENEEP